ncbi:MAG: O-acetylhomoserine aminocarboxypropyltransferase/cysteine synthase [Selenomonadaceae bacterium]|nr:O-acetylhomoserine aminocarboxypropyltransferase/cysteine synthase [Selenomonadaceae bacterium]
MKFSTELLHGITPEKLTGSTTQPIYQTSAYYQETAEDMEKIFAGKKPGFVYTRVNNPTIANFERRMTALEHGIGAVAFSSGMSAISMSIMNIVENGDEIVSNSGLFGGTNAFFKEIKNFGVNVKYVVENKIDNFAKLITEKTKLIYVETIGNPKLDISDIKSLAELAHSKNLPLFVDNTVTTPYLIRPLDFGADIVIHSTSKMINGGGNSIGGIVICGKNFKWNSEKFTKLVDFAKFGNLSYIIRLRNNMLMNFGSCAAPFNAFLTGIGLDTLELRMQQSCDNALNLAKFLSEQKNIQVNYPGLENNFYHELAKKQFNNNFGSMLTIRLKNKEKAFKFINSLKFALNVSNIGDARTLIIHPASTIYFHANELEKINAGVTDDLVRISVGLENISDLISDFDQALTKI